MVITKQVVLTLAKVAPFLGGTLVLLSFQVNAATGLSDLWRIIMSVCLAVFVTLVGAIYQNLNRRLEVLEVTAKNDLVSRREYDTRHNDLIRQLDRIEKALE